MHLSLGSCTCCSARDVRYPIAYVPRRSRTTWSSSSAVFQQVVRQTYDRNEDTFREWFLIAPCLLLAILIPQKRTPTEVSPEAFEPMLWGFHMRQA